MVRRDRYVILSHALWRSRFRADDRVVGRFIDLDGVAREVIAVMPTSFQFPSARTDVWVPLGIDATNQSHYWAGDYMPVVGRLRAGATVAPGARRDSPLPVGHRRRISLEDAGRLEPRRCGDSDGGGGSDRRQAAAADPDGRRRTRADHRLRECRQPEPVAGDGTRTRDRHPLRHWRRPPADRAAIAHRKRAARAGWRCHRPALRDRGPRRAETRAAFGHAASRRGVISTGACWRLPPRSLSCPVARSVSRPCCRRCGFGCASRWMRAAAKDVDRSPGRSAPASPSPRSRARCCW